MIYRTTFFSLHVLILRCREDGMEMLLTVHGMLFLFNSGLCYSLYLICFQYFLWYNPPLPFLPPAFYSIIPPSYSFKGVHPHVFLCLTLPLASIIRSATPSGASPPDSCLPQSPFAPAQLGSVNVFYLFVGRY